MQSSNSLRRLRFNQVFGSHCQAGARRGRGRSHELVRPPQNLCLETLYFLKMSPPSAQISRCYANLPSEGAASKEAPHADIVETQYGKLLLAAAGAEPAKLQKEAEEKGAGTDNTSESLDS